MNTRLGRNAGFTLIELMVTVVIVGILAAIAIPSYTKYVMRGNRAAAKACMLETAQFLERYYTTELKYTDAAPALGCQTDSGLNTRYTITVDTLAQNTYRVVATPVGAQLKDTMCGTLTLNQKGEPGKSGSSTVAECWSR